MCIEWSAEYLSDDLGKNDEGNGRNGDQGEHRRFDQGEDEAEKESGEVLNSQTESLRSSEADFIGLP